MIRIVPAAAIVALAAVAPLSAQTVNTQQFEITGAPGAVDTMTQATQLQFQGDRYDRMTVPVRVAGQGPYRFLVDTGADRTAISRELATALNLQMADGAVMHTVTGASQVTTATVPLLNIAAKQVRNVEAPLLEATNIGADGILGLDSLRSQRILFDFKKNVLTIVPSSGDIGALRDSIVVTGRIKNGRLILAGAWANNRKLTVIVDTGGSGLRRQCSAPANAHAPDERVEAGRAAVGHG